MVKIRYYVCVNIVYIESEYTYIILVYYIFCILFYILTVCMNTHNSANFKANDTKFVMNFALNHEVLKFNLNVLCSAFDCIFSYMILVSVFSAF